MAAVALAAVGPAAAQAPVLLGTEFQVNTYTTAGQGLSSVSVDADGDFVVAWVSVGQDGSGYGVYGQRYDAAGEARGQEFGVSTYTAGYQSEPSVAVDPNGGFVIAWVSEFQDGSGSGVYARRYAADGTAVGLEFRVNTYTAGSQYNPSVAMDADGDFVVAWVSVGQGGVLSEVYAQQYSASGAAVGEEFHVNETTTSDQYSPSVAMDADGDFVVVWNSSASDSRGIYARRYSADGAALGGESRVTELQLAPSVAMDAAGDFVVVWQRSEPGPDGFNRGIYAQRYTSAGAAAGGEFRVSTSVAGIQSTTSVTANADGDVVVVWESNGQGGDGDDVYARRYDASGASQGPEFRVNTTTTGYQGSPSVAIDAEGDVVVAWTSVGQDGSEAGVYAQRYALGTVASDPAPAGGLALAVVPSPVGPSGGQVQYEVLEAGPIRVAVTDVLGREVAVLWDGARAAGSYEATLDTGRLAPGVYVVRLTAGAATAVRRVTVVR